MKEKETRITTEAMTTKDRKQSANEPTNPPNKNISSVYFLKFVK
jgi:hypothetical protein